MGGEIFLVGVVPKSIFVCTNLLVRVKLGYPPKFNFLGKHLLGEKYVEGKKERIRKKKNNNANFSGHYVHPRTYAQHSCMIKSIRNGLQYQT